MTESSSLFERNANQNEMSRKDHTIEWNNYKMYSNYNECGQTTLHNVFQDI
jgi:hypothetical protein